MYLILLYFLGYRLKHPSECTILKVVFEMVLGALSPLDPHSAHHAFGARSAHPTTMPITFFQGKHWNVDNSQQNTITFYFYLVSPCWIHILFKCCTLLSKFSFLFSTAFRTSTIPSPFRLCYHMTNTDNHQHHIWWCQWVEHIDQLS